MKLIEGQVTGAAGVGMAGAAAMSDRGPVLVLLHHARACTGHVGRWLIHNGYEMDIRRSLLGDKLPENLHGYTGVIVFGGPMSVNDPDLAIRREIDWLARPLEQNIPFLGICLGAQMLVKQLGGTVSRREDKLVEIGYREIEPTVTGRALLSWPSRVYEWHEEGFSLPGGAELLARGRFYENQVYRYGRAAFGLQFHPEVTERIIYRWTVMDADKLALPGADPKPAHFADHRLHGPAQLHWLDDFLTHWTGLMAGGPDASQETT